MWGALLGSMNNTSKFALFNAFANGLPYAVLGVKFTVINKIEREDGSNLKYNVTGITTKGTTTTVFVPVH